MEAGFQEKHLKSDSELPSITRKAAWPFLKLALEVTKSHNS